MRVRTFEVRNFTSLENVRLQDLPNMNVFIGSNGAGKSNLLDSLVLLLSEFGSEVRRELGSSEDFQHLFPNHDSHGGLSPEISATLLLTNKEWIQITGASAMDAENQNDVELSIKKSLAVEEDMVYWLTDISGLDLVHLAEDIENGEPLIDCTIFTSDYPRVEIPLSAFLEELSELFHSSITVIRTNEVPREWDDRFSERPTILGDAAIDDLWRLNQSRGNRRRPWTAISTTFQTLAPHGQRPVGLDSSIQIEEGALTLALGMTGEGSQAMLRLVDELEHSPSIVVLEEPETHLHPGAIKRVGQMLADTAARGRQLFVSTHSPFLIEQSALESFFVVAKGGEWTTVSQLSGIEDLKKLLYGIGMRPSDILFSEAILLVEGHSDALFFSALSNTVGASLTEHHVKAVAANGYPRGKRKIEFWAEVGRDANLPLFMIVDSSAQDEVQDAVSKGHISQEHCLVLQQGELENYYPIELLCESLSTAFGIEIDQDDSDLLSNRVGTLKRLLSKKKWPGQSWKPVLAEEVASKVNRAVAERELSEIVAFLHRVHRLVRS